MSSSGTNSSVERSGDCDNEWTATGKLERGRELHDSEGAERDEDRSGGGTLGSPTSLPLRLYPSPVQLKGSSLRRSSASEAGEEESNEDIHDNERLSFCGGFELDVDVKDEGENGGDEGYDGETNTLDESGTTATILANISPRPNRGPFQLYPTLSPVHPHDSSLRRSSPLEVGEEKSYEGVDDNEDERLSFARGFERCVEAKDDDGGGVDRGDDFEADAVDVGDASMILPGINSGTSRSRSRSPNRGPSPSGSQRGHQNQDGRQPSPLEGAGLVSSWFYSWAYPLLRTGMERPIQESDLPGLMEVDKSSYNRRIVEGMWRDEVRRCEAANEAPTRPGWLHRRRRRRRGSDHDDCDDHGVGNVSGITDERTDDLTPSSIKSNVAGMAGRRRRPWRRKLPDPDGSRDVSGGAAGREPAPASSRPKEGNHRRGREKEQRPSLARAFLRDYIKATWFAQILLVVSMAARLVQAIALGRLVEQFDGTDGTGGSARAGYAWSGVLIICGAAFFLAKQKQFFITYRHGMHLRIGLVGAIYCKSLRLSSTGGGEGRRGDGESRQTNSEINGATGRKKVSGGSGGRGKSISSGQVLNLASNDVERFILASTLSIYLVYGPLEALAVLIMGLSVMGPAFAAGYALLFVFVPLQFYAGKKFALLRSKVAAVTDSRVSLVTQAVSGVRVMKMSGWECQFEEQIRKIRDAEILRISKASRYKAWNEATHFSANVVISVVTFSFHVLAGGTLTSRIVFTTMSLVNILQSTVAKMVSQAVMCLSECYVSTNRIQVFLQLPELPHTPYDDVVADVPCTESDNKDCVPGAEIMHLLDVTCYWNDSKAQLARQTEGEAVKSLTLCGVDTSSPSSPAFAGEKGRFASDSVTAALCNVTLRLNAGILYCVIGSTGCGKSALLQAIAGELRPRSGTIERRRAGVRVSVGSSRFLAYAPQDSWIMDGSVRENILLGLAFDQDWYDTVVSACGLSVDLARFASGDKTIVGDRGVQCSGGQRARIGLARAIYRDADLVLLDDPLSAVDSKVGRWIYYSAIVNLCVKRGKCVVLATHQHQFIGENTCILMDKGRVLFKGSYSDCIDASGGKLTASLSAKNGDQAVAISRRGEGSESLKEGATMIIENDPKCEPNSDSVHKEERATGLVSLKTWRNYANAMGGVLVGIGLLFLFAVTQTSALVSIIFIGKWAEIPPPQQDSPSWLGLVFGLAIMLIFLSVVRARSSLLLCIKASQRLHDRMTRSVLRARIEFFDTNPLGRILNRFSADIGVCDDLLPLTIYDFLVGAFSAFGSVATAIVVLPFTLIAIPPLLWCFVRYRKVFVTTTRELKRLEGLARSPIYALIGEAPGGVATIRSNDAADYFRQKFEAAHDAHTRAFFAFVASSRWFAIRMDMIAYIFMSIASLLAVLFQDKGWFDVDPAIIGLTLTMLLQMAGTNFPWVVRQSAEVVNQMVSVERVSSYGELPSEAALVKDRDEELKKWPQNPSIVVADLTVRYRSSLPPALSRVTFKIAGGQKVGVVGRTGSGKSSLVQALFRILEAEAGTIEVDGVDISQLGLHKVRTQMSVIPQAPVLFGGCSILENLDPFRQFKETTVRSALSDVQLLDTIDGLPAGIHSIVSDGGSNFSVGQRQLLCLARAILQRNKILVLDEPTANVDSYTETLLQEAIGKRFVGATLISVAHRLDTVIDHDLVLVLGESEVLEYGSPVQLLSLGGHFASMVDSTGEEMATSLRRRAQSSVLSPLLSGPCTSQLPPSS